MSSGLLYVYKRHDTLEKLKSYISENNLSEVIMIKGNLCEGLCKDGPNIRINGIVYHDIDFYSVLKVIDEILARED
jgi:NADH:ubiquinone oxidoreductase subunit E